jgi:hypothetical protein
MVPKRSCLSVPGLARGRWTVAGFGATLRPLQRFNSRRSGRQDQSGFFVQSALFARDLECRRL